MAWFFFSTHKIICSLFDKKIFALFQCHKKQNSNISYEREGAFFFTQTAACFTLTKKRILPRHLLHGVTLGLTQVPWVSHNNSILLKYCTCK